MIPAHEFLRNNTSDCHKRVDQAFARFDLTEANSYRAFLSSHARALVPIEEALGSADSLPRWRSRLTKLSDDLTVLGTGLPTSPALTAFEPAGTLAGMLYVIEGSRLGGRVLARSVGSGLPTGYLLAVHQQGEWRTLLTALDAQAVNEPQEWLDNALAGARRAFDLFADAAQG
jgi:heme oxygenase